MIFHPIVHEQYCHIQSILYFPPCSFLLDHEGNKIIVGSLTITAVVSKDGKMG